MVQSHPAEGNAIGERWSILTHLAERPRPLLAILALVDIQLQQELDPSAVRQGSSCRGQTPQGAIPPKWALCLLSILGPYTTETYRLRTNPNACVRKHSMCVNSTSTMWDHVHRTVLDTSCLHLCAHINIHSIAPMEIIPIKSSRLYIVIGAKSRPRYFCSY